MDRASTGHAGGVSETEQKSAEPPPERWRDSRTSGLRVPQKMGLFVAFKSLLECSEN